MRCWLRAGGSQKSFFCCGLPEEEEEEEKEEEKERQNDQLAPAAVKKMTHRFPYKNWHDQR